MSVIHIKNLRKCYGSFEALKGVSFEVNRGEVLGFLGPNGAGKTTTMKILSCYMAATSGEASVAGYDCFKHPLEVRKKIGYLPENNPLYTEMKVYEYLRYMADLHDVPESIADDRVRRVAEDCGLFEKMGEGISALSKGYKQRVGLAATLVHDPEILILDEPTVGLDPNQIVEIRNLIKKLGREKTVILCSHLLTEIELTCNRLIIIHNGSIVASGTPAELRQNVDEFSTVKVVIRGEKETAETLLRSLSGIRDIHMFSVREKNACGFELIISRHRDPRPLIAQAVVENGLQLMEIHRELASLESIFTQVTRNATES